MPSTVTVWLPETNAGAPAVKSGIFVDGSSGSLPQIIPSRKSIQSGSTRSRNTVTVENVHPNTTVSFRMNNLSGSAADLELYAYGADGKLAEVSKELWTITDEAGTGVDTLADGTLYELRVSVADGGALDLSEEEKKIIISVVLAK